jgi:CHAT domain-containing protein
MPHVHPSPRIPARWTTRAAVLAALLAAASGCGTAHGDEAPAGLLAELAREVPSAPAIAPRLSISGPRPPCTPPQADAEGPRTPCPAAKARPRPERIARIAARAAQGVRTGTDAGAIHTTALIDLLFEGGGGKSLDRAISSLRTAAELSDHPAPVLADLAAAYLVRAERTHSARDLFAAMETAERAVEQEPANLAARYNLALALQRAWLTEEAAYAWQAYLAADSSSAWAAQARSNLREAAAPHAPPAPPAADAPLSAYESYAGAEPQGARIHGWCRLLGDWAARMLEGDAAGAESRLSRAEALGNALATRHGGDGTLRDAVRVIRRQPPGAASRRLARAHGAFSAGCAAASRADFPAGVAPFASATQLGEASPPLLAWARVMYGDMLFHTGQSRRGEAILRREAAAADANLYPALAGRARQGLASLLVRSDRYVSAGEQAELAAALFIRAGERENEGVARDGMAMASFGLRDMDAGYGLAHAAMEQLGPYRASYRLHNLLFFTAVTLGNDGFPRAALRMQNEGVRVAERTGLPVFVAEARLTRARLRAAAGDLHGAAEDVAAGGRAVARLDEPRARAWMTAQLRMAQSATTLRADPARAAVALDSAAAFLLEMHSPLLALPAVVNGARASLDAGDTAGATRRLRTALAILEQRRDSIRMEPRRAAVFESARTVVDRVAMLRLAAGSPGEALSYLDRGRASLAPVGGGEKADAYGVVSGPLGETVLEYALVADTLLAWTVAGRRVEIHRSVVDTLRLARTIDEVRRQLEAGRREADVQPGLARLYDWLVRPVAARLGSPGAPVVVIADGAIASLPFAALYDGVRRRYLVEDHPVRFAVSLREARRRARRAGAADPAVFVANPAFDPARHPGFERLPQAELEVATIAPGYPGGRVLAPEQADGAALRGALGRARILHYAGHAVFDDERPERSYLLLARTPGQAGASILQAEEIAQMDLRHVSLVVLSACHTVRTGEGRAAGFSGLAGAFLAAGVGGAVGSLWEVDDARTQPLMVAFHQAYRVSSNGPEALRAAQLGLLRSRDPSLRSPTAWAAFRYMGG